MFRLLGFFLCVLLVAGAPAPAAAQTDEQREQARRLATEGFEALQRRDFAVAEDCFRRADALVHAPTLVVDHARALVGLGRLVEAHERYELVRREGVPPTAPWQWRRALLDAEQELTALKARLAWLTIQVSGPSEPNVRIDSKPVPLAALGVRRATDPGTHAVSVSAPGFRPKEEMVTLDEGESESITIELEPVPTEAPPPPPAPVEPVAVEPPKASSSGSKTLAYVALGAGGVGIAAGIVAGVVALGARSELNAECPRGVCVPRTRDELDRDKNALDRYHTFGTLSGIGFAFGAAAAGTGVALLLLARSAPASGFSPPMRALPVRAAITRRGLDVTLETAF